MNDPGTPDTRRALCRQAADQVDTGIPLGAVGPIAPHLATILREVGTLLAVRPQTDRLTTAEQAVVDIAAAITEGQA